MHSITIKSDKPVVVLSVEEYESMKETLELLVANPSLPEELEQERRNIAKGKGITWSEFKKKRRVR